MSSRRSAIAKGRMMCCAICISYELITMCFGMNGRQIDDPFIAARIREQIVFRT